ncbi:MAG: thioredoxin family protein [Micrococcales bacterium]
MPLEIRLGLIAALVAVSLFAGLIWKARTGRAHRVKSGEQIDLSKLEAVKHGKPVRKFGKKATALQFSTEVCSQCRQTARVFSELETKKPELLHIEVDVTNRMDLAAHFKVLQTPTTLILDSKGIVRARIGGAPKPNVIKEELAKLEVH